MTGAPINSVPSNLDAEQALLGSVLCFPEAFFQAAGVTGEHFFEPVHGELWDAAAAKIQGGGRALPEVLARQLAAHPAFTDLGGLQYLADLIDRAPPPANTGGYAAEVLETAQLRALQHLAAGVQGAVSERLKPEEIIGQVERAAAEIARNGPGGDAWLAGGSVVQGAIQSARARDGRVAFTTGVPSVDELTGGFNAGELHVIGARPGMGKTLVGTTIARANAQAGVGSSMFSLEMDAEALGVRVACDVAYDRSAVRYSGETDNPTLDRARKKLLSPDAWARLEAAGDTVRGWPLHFDFRAGLRVPEMERALGRLLRRWERKSVTPGPVVIDHLGIARPDQSRNGNKTAEISDISRGLAEMAKRLHVPVVALCQLSRGVEGREDKRPTLSDLRWSGEIEQDARQVIFLYRPEYYVRPPENPEDIAADVEYRTQLAKVRNRLLWIVAKNNNGPLGEVETFCDVACSVMRDMHPAELRRAA